MPVEIIIGPAKAPEHANTYVLTVTFMSGDADHFDDEGYECTFEQAEAAVAFLETMKREFRYKPDSVYCLGGDWRALPCAWVVEGFYDYKAKVPDGKESFIDWPDVCTSDGDGYAYFYSYKLTWYDGHGVAHDCTVEFSA